MRKHKPTKRALRLTAQAPTTTPDPRTLAGLAALRERIERTQGEPYARTMTGAACTLAPEAVGAPIEARAWLSLADIQRANKAAGLYFFDLPALRFFRSVIGKHEGAGIFKTTERDPRGVRRWSVRLADASGSVHTLGDFHAIEDGRTASRYAREAVRILLSGGILSDGRGRHFKLPNA